MHKNKVFIMSQSLNSDLKSLGKITKKEKFTGISTSQNVTSRALITLPKCLPKKDRVVAACGKPGKNLFRA